jgi:serine/threonine-protein kinase
MRIQVGTGLSQGRYILQERLKRTGMAEVWLASQKGGIQGFSKTVVVKMIHPDLSEQSEARQRFFDEAKFAAQIRHPNVVEIYDFGEEEGIFYLVMEYIEGRDLETLITKSKASRSLIPIPLICRLMADASKGLQVIHALRDPQGRPLDLVHRDISPQNLVVSRNGIIKIIDFGIVKAREKSSRTRTGVIVGKLQYMSPEQLSSEELDSRSDIFSLGLVMFELLTLEPRFRGSNLLEVFYEALNEPIPDILSKRADCPPDVVDCALRSMAQSKDARFQRAHEMQRALEAYLIKIGMAITETDIARYLAQLFNEPFTEPQAYSPSSAAYDGDQTSMAVGGGDGDQTMLAVGGGDGDQTMMAGAVSPMYNAQQRNEQHTFSGKPLVNPRTGEIIGTQDGDIRTTENGLPESDPFIDDPSEMRRIQKALGPAASAAPSHTFDSRSMASAPSSLGSGSPQHTFARSAPLSEPEPPTPKQPRSPAEVRPPPRVMQPAPPPPMPSHHPLASQQANASPFAQMDQRAQARPPQSYSHLTEATALLSSDEIAAAPESTMVLPKIALNVLEPPAGSSPSPYGTPPAGHMDSDATMIPSRQQLASYGLEEPLTEASQETVVRAIPKAPQKPKMPLPWIVIGLGSSAFLVGLFVVYLLVRR